MLKKAKVIMVQGTGSYVGKSVLVAALCRIFKQDGFRVAPFKAQNMALNSYVTADGKEMGRAQVTQAEAAGIQPRVDMNPILLKPSADTKAQVIVNGRLVGNMSGQQYYRQRKRLLKVVTKSYRNLRDNYEIVVIEGAGSPAEVNLRRNDLVNMTMAKIADCPVILVGDINVGGVFAWVVGTLELLTPAERKRIKGVVINKFRGDLKILKPGLDFLEKKIKRPVLGVVPYFHDIVIPEEDSVARERYASAQKAAPDKINIEVLYLPHISNFTDFDPLENEPGVTLRYVSPGERIGNPDCLVIPGSKNTIADLSYLKKSGIAQAIMDRAKAGTMIVGICGGYQMLGARISDPSNVESRRSKILGLGLLPLSTIISKKKLTHQVKAKDLVFKSGKVAGYEIHMGETFPTRALQRAFRIIARSKKGVGIVDGAISANGRIWGSYIHGLFENDAFRTKFLDSLRRKKKISAPGKSSENYFLAKEREYNKLAALTRKSINMPKIYSLMGIPIKKS